MTQNDHNGWETAFGETTTRDGPADTRPDLHVLSKDRVEAGTFRITGTRFRLSEGAGHETAWIEADEDDFMPVEA